jgi:hypothetical protein
LDVLFEVVAQGQNRTPNAITLVQSLDGMVHSGILLLSDSDRQPRHDARQCFTFTETMPSLVLADTAAHDSPRRAAILVLIACVTGGEV